MAKETQNLRNLTFLLADANPFLSSICQSILRGFGASRIVEARDTTQAARALHDYKIDVVLCDLQLPPDGGLAFTTAIRSDSTSDRRSLPILIMASDTRAATIRAARDSGAHMVIAKPLSPARLFDRLLWAAFTPRVFIDTPTYFGPDRRFKNEGFAGIGRRKGDNVVELGDTDPAPSAATPGRRRRGAA